MTRPIIGRVASEQRRSPGAQAPGHAGRDVPVGVVAEPGTARIAVDLLGGDHAPAVVVDGALRACQADPALQLLLVGPIEAAGEVLAALNPADRARVTTLAAPADRADLTGTTSPAGQPADMRRASQSGVTQVEAGQGGAGRATAGQGEPGQGGAGQGGPGRGGPGRRRVSRDNAGRTSRPAESWVESGVRTAVLAVAQGLADAAVSAGNTGATVTSAALGLGRWPGVRRPPLAAVLPTAAGRVVLLDVGSSVDSDENTLAMHAALGAAYASVVHGVAEPRVGLLTIGTERGKGDRLRRAAATLFPTLALPANARYAGLVEGNDVVLGEVADVVVCDGFTGNVLLKGLETAYAVVGPPGAAADVPPRAAILLGVAGTIVVCHGAADAHDLAAGIAFAADLHRRAVVAAIAGLIPHDEVAHD
ncbi:MAG TPA: phosphate acyltransferase PlsX [Actinoplanes sp.]|nr:phosphate acyltransferase PlsX [Actinoplanes sp.]